MQIKKRQRYLDNLSNYYRPFFVVIEVSAFVLQESAENVTQIYLHVTL